MTNNIIIKQTRCTLKFTNNGKLETLNNLAIEMQRVVNLFIDKLWEDKNFTSKYVDFKVDTYLTARMQQCLGKIALQNVKSQRKKNLKHKPNFQSMSFDLDYRFFNIQDISSKSFDMFLKISSIKKNISINIPIKKHTHYNRLINLGFKCKNSIRLIKKNNIWYVDFIFEKTKPIKKTNGNVIGCDLGYKKLITLSSNKTFGKDDLQKIYHKISNKKQSSKAFKKSLTQRNNYINYLINNIDLINIKELVCEDLKSVKYKAKFSRKTNNKLARWIYPKVLEKLEARCDMSGVLFSKVNPRYTSQKCSCCGVVDKKSRKLEDFKCTTCGLTIDADLNASINLSHMGTYSSHALLILP
jgi:putative transposase